MPESESPSDTVDAQQANTAYQSTLIASVFNKKSSQIADTKTQAALNIYANNYIENGIRALSISFPTVVGFIGEDSFRVLAKQFLTSHCKTSFDWADYGEQLPRFIENEEALHDYPFLSEVALLDWRIHHIQRLPDKDFQPASFALLENGDISELSFVTAPGLGVVECWFPVVELHQLIHDPHLQSEAGVVARQKLLKNITKSINNVINTPTPRSLVLWRAEYKAQFNYLSDTEADVLNKLTEQASVNAVIETIGTHNIDLVEWLSNAISHKLIFAVA